MKNRTVIITIEAQTNVKASDLKKRFGYDAITIALQAEKDVFNTKQVRVQVAQAPKK